MLKKSSADPKVPDLSLVLWVRDYDEAYCMHLNYPIFVQLRIQIPFQREKGSILFNSGLSLL